MLSPSPRRPMWCMSTVMRLHCFIVYRCKPVLARQPSDRNLLCLSLDGCAGSYRHWRLSCLASASTASWFFSTGWCGVGIKFTNPLVLFRLRHPANRSWRAVAADNPLISFRSKIPKNIHTELSNHLHGNLRVASHNTLLFSILTCDPCFWIFLSRRPDVHFHT